ncbi:relaxase/mobilization nuclease domain-containing protein [Salmonella enterica subsp. enterica serovar Kedougou]|nr:relaxase/mobilization nuclease domain-containing protein [Salmonella enterica subsp. enterica serovar Kedougou]
MAVESLSKLLEGKVKTKSNKTTDLKGKASRIANRASEVMVKVSGNAKGPAHVKAHLDYISRNGKLELENERGEILKGKDDVKAVHKEWTQDQGKRRANTRDTTNVVLSMPKGTEAKAVKESARAFAKNQFGENYQYVFALHEDVDHPHVHISIKTLGFDGRRLHVKKGDPQIWREGFAKELRARGVEAEATPRATRGVVKKGIDQAILHIRKRGLTPEVDKAKIKEIVEEFKDTRAGKPAKAKPWEKKIQTRQQEVRKGWLSAAQELNQSSEPGDKKLAADVVNFVNTMPPMATERHEMAKAVSQKLASQQPGKKQNSTGRDRDNDQEER